MLIDCLTCGGTGRGMKMVCYGGAPYEVEDDCPDCEDGQIEIEDSQAAPPKSRNVREGRYAGKKHGHHFRGWWSGCRVIKNLKKRDKS